MMVIFGAILVSVGTTMLITLRIVNGKDMAKIKQTARKRAAYVIR